MEINAQKVKELRAKQHWTQQHLADACDISLRTVQRVERYGNASNETLMSLAAVFNIDKKLILADAVPIEVIEHETRISQKQLLLVAAASGMLIGALLMYLMMLI